MGSSNGATDILSQSRTNPCIKEGMNKNTTWSQLKFLAAVLIVQHTLDELLHPGADCATHPLRDHDRNCI